MRFIRPWTRASLLMGLILLPGGCGAGGPTQTEILWDRWGVPHIYAPDAEALMYAFGWAQAHNHGDRILRLYGEARGRAAEYWGEDHLDTDRWVRTVGIPDRAEAWYEAQDPRIRRYADAFAAGINAYAAAHPDRIADEVERVLPVRGADVFAHVQRVIHFTFMVNPRQVQAAARRLEAGAGAGAAAAPAAGSNAWAIGPSRSSSDNAMLLANPHLPWSGVFTWIEAQLTAPELDAYGAALIGTPFLGIAFNDRLGWTHTVNTHDGADLYELHLVDDGYRFDGAVRPFDEGVDTILVRGPDGGMREVVHRIRRSVHGPVVAEAGDRALALRVVGLDRPHLMRQYWDMARARDLEAFEAALRQLQMPMFTVMYADAEGHIMHLFGGLTPVRPRGGWDDWAGIVPGDTSATLWTEVHPYEDLPRVVDPATGWLQNANDPPWTTTLPRALSPDTFPPYMAPRGMAFRSQRSARMLVEDDAITFDEMVRYKHSTRMELADRLLDELIPAVRRHGGHAARRAADVLEAWDRSADADSRGGVLFKAFVDELLRRGGLGRAFAESWDPDAPLSTPDGLRDPAAAVAALEAAARTVEERFGALDVAWGDAHRLRHAERDLPANGGSGLYGIFRVTGYGDAPDGRYVAVFGDSYVAAVEFSDPVRARALLSYGNASQPGSPHAGDQLELYARQELRPVWRTREAIEANLERREQLDPAAVAAAGGR